MNFNLFFPNKIIFGAEESYNLGNYIYDLSKKPLLIFSSSFKNNDNYKKIIFSLKNKNIDFIEYDNAFKGEPTIEIVDEITNFAVNNKIDSVVSIGGGSIIDAGKAVSSLVNNEKGVKNYLEGIGTGKKIINDPVPFIAVPTIAGSGAEVTKNAVITSKDDRVKRSFRDDRMAAKVVIIDPMLTLSLPTNVAIYSAMDAVCQLIQSFVSLKQNIFCKSISGYILPLALDAILETFNKPANIQARAVLSYSGLISGICLANSGLGAVHGFASSLGGMFDIPHGLICAILTPGVFEMNENKKQGLYDELANFTKSINSRAFIEKLKELNETLNIPLNFKNFNILAKDINEIVRNSKGSSMNGNPVNLTDEDLFDFIKRYI